MLGTGSPRAVVLKPKQSSEAPGRSLNPRPPDLFPGVSDSVGLQWSREMCIADKQPSGADTAGLGTTVWEPPVLGRSTHGEDPGDPCARTG